MADGMPVWAVGLVEQPVVLMDLADESLILACGNNGIWQQQSLPLGIGGLARRYFSHSPVWASAWEAAIQTVEDAIAPMRKQIPAHSRLWVRQTDFAGLPGAVAQNVDWAWLSIEAAEAAFNSLAVQAEGLPVPADLPRTPAFAARLLILREWLHHMGFDGATVAREAKTSTTA